MAAAAAYSRCLLPFQTGASLGLNPASKCCIVSGAAFWRVNCPTAGPAGLRQRSQSSACVAGYVTWPSCSELGGGAGGGGNAAVAAAGDGGGRSDGDDWSASRHSDFGG